MLNLRKQQFLPYILAPFIALSASLACADDLTDARNAYGAGQFEEAATLLRPLVRQENIEAVYLLARMYEQGDGVEKDLEEAKRLLRLAAKNGNDAAQQRLDIFDAQGEDDSVVVEWYLPSAEEGDTEAQYNLAFMYETGWGVQINEKKAIRWYQDAADMQHDVAQLRLGMMLIVGVGTQQSVNNGLLLLRRSAENGNRISETLVQDLFDVGDVEIEDAIRIVAGIRRVLDEGEKHTLETLRRSLELLHKKAEKEQLVPVVKIQPQKKPIDVVKLVTGKNTTENSQTRKNAVTSKGREIKAPNEPKKSQGNLFSWYLNTANQGEVDSQYHAGVMYIKGEQVEKDIDEGVRWIKLAAEQGHEMAITYMKLWDDDFSVNTFDSSISVRWLKDAGRNFDTNAIFNLAFLYETGRGVKKNFNTAKQWYKFAAVEGHQDAKRRLALLNKNSVADDGVTATQNRDVELNIPVILGLLVALFACIGFYYYRHQKGSDVSMPNIDFGEHDVINQAATTQGLKVDDKKLFDELWATKQTAKSTVPKKTVNEAKSNTSNEKEPERKIEGKPKKQSPDIMSNKSAELSEVEQKLSKAIDELMSIGKTEHIMAGQSEEILYSKITKATDGSAATEVQKKKSDENEVESGVVSSHDLKDAFPTNVLGDTLDQKSESFHAPSKKPNQQKASLDSKRKSGEFAAESFLSNGISMDELAASRISADSLFADGVAIDEAGKAVGRGSFNPRKFDVNDALSLDGIASTGTISKGAISSNSPKKRPVGAAASLLPKRSDELIASDMNSNLEQKVTTSSIVEPVDVSAPLTNSEERSLAEVHFNIGIMFSEGDGVPQNEAQAAKWFLKAAEEGMPEAQYNIGRCYMSGSGVAKDITLAAEWIQKAANNSYKPAQEALKKKNWAS